MPGGRIGGWWWGWVAVALGLLWLPLAGPRTAGAQAPLEQSLPQRFTAVAANLSNIRIGPTVQTIQIVITRWSTDGEVDRLLTTLKERGEKALLGELQKMPKVGSFRTPNSLAYDLRFARQMPWGDGGRRIFIATDRYINFWELANQSRTLEYPFTLIEMRLDHQGKGEGKLSVATKVMADGDQLVLEDYANQPVMLTKVTQEK